MGSRRGMYAVDAVRRDVHSALESESHVRSPEIIIDRLRQRHNVQALFPQHIRRLMSSVAAQDHKTVQTKLIVILLHRLHLVQSVLVRLSHQFKRCSGASQDRASLCQNTGKVRPCKHSEVAVDQSLIPLQEAVNFHGFPAAGQTFYYASHRRIERLTVTATGKHTDSFHLISSFIPFILPSSRLFPENTLYLPRLSPNIL